VERLDQLGKDVRVGLPSPPARRRELGPADFRPDAATDRPDALVERTGRPDHLLSGTRCRRIVVTAAVAGRQGAPAQVAVTRPAGREPGRALAQPAFGAEGAARRPKRRRS
jgi:hypothetical protein